MTNQTFILARIAVFSLAGVALVFGDAIGAEDKKELTDKAYEEYQSGNYQAALDLYNEAGRGLPHSSGLEFNKGLTNYKFGNVEQALKNLESASLSEDPELAGNAHFNQGNALYEQEDFQNSVEQFKNALRRNPDDAEARHNLELALRKLAQQEKQEQEQNEDQKGDQDQEKKDEEQESKENQEKQDQDKEQENKDQQDQQENKQNPDSSQSAPEQKPQQHDPNQMSKEDAERLLNALKDEEMKHQKNKRIMSAKVYRGKDW